MQPTTSPNSRGQNSTRSSSNHTSRVIHSNHLSSQERKSRSPIINSSINNTIIDLNKQRSNSKPRPRTSRSNPRHRTQSLAFKLIFKYKYSSRNHQRNNHHQHNHSRYQSSSLSSLLSHSRSTSLSLPRLLPLGRIIITDIDLTHIGVQ